MIQFDHGGGWDCDPQILKNAPGETPATAGEDARAPQGIARAHRNSFIIVL
jgi:hypothetical protein